jgi:hypothetical protein
MPNANIPIDRIFVYQGDKMLKLPGISTNFYTTILDYCQAG